MGLLDFDVSKIVDNPAFGLGINILGANYGNYGHTGPALSEGLRNFQRQRSLMAQQNRANSLANQRNSQIVMQQEQFDRQRGQNDQAMKLTGGLPVDLWKHQNPNYKASDTPSNIREWNAYNKMPQKQKEGYLNMKRAGQKFDNGMYQGFFNPVNQKPMPQLKNQLGPGELPAAKQAQAAASKRGAMMAQSKAQSEIDWPQTKFNGEYTIGLIDKAISHPGRMSGTGLSSLVPSRPGGPAYNFDIIMKQIKGKQFLTAFEQLKGAGQITEIEGQKATEAEARMDQAQGESEFLEALNEYKSVINALMERASKRAGIPYSASPLETGLTTEEQAEFKALEEQGKREGWAK